MTHTEHDACLKCAEESEDKWECYDCNAMGCAQYDEIVAPYKKKLAIAVEALGWYAEMENYAGKCDDYQDPNCPIWSETDNDKGSMAREALKKIGEVK